MQYVLKHIKQFVIMLVAILSTSTAFSGTPAQARTMVSYKGMQYQLLHSAAKDSLLGKMVPFIQVGSKHIGMISGKDAEFLTKHFKMKAGVCSRCHRATTAEDQAHPNKFEKEPEEGDITMWNEGCKCYQTYHYVYTKDNPREVCCYYDADSRCASHYVWVGMDNQLRCLSQEEAAKPAPECKD